MATAPSPIIVPHGPQKVDENGEVIIAEAIFCRHSLSSKLSYPYNTFACAVYVALGLCLVGIPCCLLCVCMGCVIGSHGASAWRLYLTSTGLHYTSVRSRGCVREKKFIPLSDIRDASFQESIFYGQDYKSVNTNIVKIIKTNYETVEFNSILNATDFCAAIKQQKQA